MFESILCQVTDHDPDIRDSLIGLAVEIAREGREGRRVGTLFTLGDENAVLARSRPLILDPLVGHPEASRHVTNLNLRGTIKELAQLDGGFVVSREGIVLSACCYLDAVAAQVDVPLGLGSRHIAAAKLMPSCTSVAGSNQCARRPRQVLHNASPVSVRRRERRASRVGRPPRSQDLESADSTKVAMRALFALLPASGFLP